MATEGGGSRPDREKLVSLRPSADDFPGAREMDAEAQARLRLFSDEARFAVRELTLEYWRALVQASISAKKKVRGEQVSRSNVEEGFYNMRRQEGQFLEKISGIGGGLLVGTALSTLASMIQSGTFTSGGTIVSVSTGIAGAFLIALHLKR